MPVVPATGFCSRPAYSLHTSPQNWTELPRCFCSACTWFVNLGEWFHSFLSLDHTVSSSSHCLRHEQPPSDTLNSLVLRHLKCKDYSNLNNEPTAERTNLCLHTIIASFLSLFFKSNHVLSAKKLNVEEPWKFKSSIRIFQIQCSRCLGLARW